MKNILIFIMVAVLVAFLLVSSYVKIEAMQSLGFPWWYAFFFGR